jgi:hypothetical protein
MGEKEDLDARSTEGPKPEEIKAAPSACQKPSSSLASRKPESTYSELTLFSHGQPPGLPNNREKIIRPLSPKPKGV